LRGCVPSHPFNEPAFYIVLMNSRLTAWHIFILCMSFLAQHSCKENLNEPVVEDQEFEVEENAPAGTIVGVVIAYDLETDQTLSYRICSGNEGGTFALDAGSGHLTVEDPSLLDYEERTALEFEVAVSDDGDPPLESKANIKVTIKDLNEYPPVVNDQSFQIEANPEPNALIGMIEASDPETQQGLIFTIISGNEDNLVSLDSGTGALRVQNASAFRVEEDTQFKFGVQVRDLHIDSKSDTAEITVTIIAG
jgi:hypothetical protein